MFLISCFYETLSFWTILSESFDETEIKNVYSVDIKQEQELPHFGEIEQHLSEDHENGTIKKRSYGGSHGGGHDSGFGGKKNKI